MVSLTPTEVLCKHLWRSIVLGLGSWNFDLVLVNQGHLYSFILVIHSLCLFCLFIQSRSFQGVIRFPYSNSNYFVGSLSPLGWFQRMVTPEYHCYTLILFGWPLGFFDSLHLLNQYLVGWSCSHAWYIIFYLADLHLGGNLGNLPECIPCYPQSRALLWVFTLSDCPICTRCTSLDFKGFYSDSVRLSGYPNALCWSEGLSCCCFCRGWLLR